MTQVHWALLTFQGGGSDKFYSVWQADRWVAIHYGRNGIGTIGQFKATEHPSVTAASVAFAKAIERKQVKGYVQQSTLSPPPITPAISASVLRRYVEQNFSAPPATDELDELLGITPADDTSLADLLADLDTQLGRMNAALDPTRSTE